MAQKVTTQPTAWVGWIFFASVMLQVLGGLQIIAGLVGIFRQSFYVLTSSSTLMAFNYTAWGWIHLILGIVTMLAGIGILAGLPWARFTAIVVAVVAMLSNITFLTAYPLWSIVALVINGFVIYALAMHGQELEN